METLPHEQPSQIQQDVRLVLFSFIDENVHAVYSPALDLYGYGNDEEEARRSFSTALEEYLDYTRENDTLLPDLARLGWQIDASTRTVAAPSLEETIRRNPEFGAVLTNRPLKTYHRIVRLDAFGQPA